MAIKPANRLIIEDEIGGTVTFEACGDWFSVFIGDDSSDNVEIDRDDAHQLVLFLRRWLDEWA